MWEGVFVWGGVVLARKEETLKCEEYEVMFVVWCGLNIVVFIVVIMTVIIY